MITYPSTHGVFEERVKDVCELIHGYGASYTLMVPILMQWLECVIQDNLGEMYLI